MQYLPANNFAFPGDAHISFHALLTLAELKLIVGAIYANYITKIVDAEGIEQRDAYTSGPKGNKLILDFQRV